MQVQYNEALLMLRKSLNIYLSVVGYNHSSIANIYGNVGLVNYHQGKYDEAYRMFQKSLDIKLSVFHHNHPGVAESYDQIGLVKNQQGKYDEALSMFQKSLNIKLTVLCLITLALLPHITILQLCTL